jgi:hypothetical protein
MRMRIPMLAPLAGILLSLPVAGSSLALDTLTPGQASAATGSEECPVLTQVKYPFLACATSPSGGKILVATGDVATNVSGRQGPYGLEFPEGSGYWGRTPDTRDGRLTDW